MTPWDLGVYFLTKGHMDFLTKGQTIREAFEEVGNSPDTYHILKTGKTENPHPTTVRSIEGYITRAEKAHARYEESPQ